ncbi:hypothetical protein O3G_MSEX014430 [Manduca sexta]|uniref:Pre-C2HC domain-containing protein n=1 Tax=Manduca sexta TaxID=7130 RepID=A0A921ZVQ4_MANSE|nr:hypothetical protein O3G_MSEX014430 [Manduca sexta]
MAESRPMDTDEPAADVNKAKHAMLTALASYIRDDPIFSSYVRSILVANEPRAVPDSPESPASPASSIDSPESPASSDSSESSGSSDGSSPPGSLADAVDPDLAMDSDPGAPQLSAVPVACASKRPVSPAPSESRSGAASSDLDDDGFTTVRNGRRKKQRGSDAPASQAPSAPSAPSAPKQKPAASQPAPASSTDSSPPTQPKGPKKPPKVNLQLPEGASLQSFFDALTSGGIKIPPNAWNSGQKLLSLQPGSISDHRELTKFLDSKRYHYYTFALPDERRYRYVIRGIPLKMSAAEVQQGLQAKGIAALEVHRMHRKSRLSRRGIQYEMVLAILATPADVKALYELSDISGLGGFTVETPHKTS